MFILAWVVVVDRFLAEFWLQSLASHTFRQNQSDINLIKTPYLIETKSINIKNFLDPMDEDQAYRNVTLE